MTGWHLLAGADELLQRRLVTDSDRSCWVSHLRLDLRYMK